VPYCRNRTRAADHSPGPIGKHAYYISGCFPVVPGLQFYRTCAAGSSERVCYTAAADSLYRSPTILLRIGSAEKLISDPGGTGVERKEFHRFGAVQLKAIRVAAFAHLPGCVNPALDIEIIILDTLGYDLGKIQDCLGMSDQQGGENFLGNA